GRSSVAGRPWLPEEDAWFFTHPTGDHADFLADTGSDRTWHAWRQRRKVLSERVVTRPLGDEHRPGGTQTVREPASDEAWDRYFSDLFAANEHDLSTMQQTTDWHAP